MKGNMRSILTYPIRRIIEHGLSRRGLQPFGVYRKSKENHVFEWDSKRDLPVSNLVGRYWSMLRQYWECHGLGKTCLLVSEPRRVGAEMATYYPSTQFVTDRKSVV